MTVLMADNCWKACSPHPTNKALFTPLDFPIFLSVSEKDSKKNEIIYQLKNVFPINSSRPGQTKGIQFVPSKHTTSFWRCYNIVWTSATLLKRWNDIAWLLGSWYMCWLSRCLFGWIPVSTLIENSPKENWKCYPGKIIIIKI